jgi:hypothetical protein
MSEEKGGRNGVAKGLMIVIEQGNCEEEEVEEGEIEEENRSKEGRKEGRRVS